MWDKQPGLRTPWQWQEQQLQLRGASSGFVLKMSSSGSVESSRVQVVILEQGDKTCPAGPVLPPWHTTFPVRLGSFTGFGDALCCVSSWFKGCF